MGNTSSKYTKVMATAALLLLLLGGCTGPLGADGIAGSSPLSFEAGIDVTKASLKTAFTNGDKFKVWAQKSGESTRLFNGAVVSYNGSEWEYENTRPLWKFGETISFVACSPADNIFCTSILPVVEVGTGNIGFNIDGYVLNQSQDLLLGCYSGKGSNGKAPLKFSHALAALEFRLGEAAPDWVTDITKISVTAASRGNCAADFSSDTPIVWSSQGSNAAVEQTLSGQAKTQGATIGTPFLAIPQSSGSFTVSVTVSHSGGTKTFSLTLSGVDLAPGRKNIYSVCLPRKTGIGEIAVDSWSQRTSNTPVIVE